MTACAYTAVRNHSRDRVEVHHGRPTPTTLCGLHATELWLPEVLTWLAKPHKATRDLEPGDRVVLSTWPRTVVGPDRTGATLVRTVKEVVPSGTVNEWNEPLFNVMYQEGATDEWGPGNSGCADTMWEVEA